jgi:sec1 family domain-containing protein 1
MGITLNMMLHTRRQRVPDAPAIYFVQPTEENIQMIAKDCAAELYDSCYINFTSTVPRPLMETLAREIMNTGRSNCVVKVHDQYCDFVSVEKQVLSLNHKNSFANLHSENATEASIKKQVDAIVDCLFGVVVTMGVIPVLRYRRGHAAEMVAAELHKR